VLRAIRDSSEEPVYAVQVHFLTPAFSARFGFPESGSVAMLAPRFIMNS
jgi:hypothetical protein